MGQGYSGLTALILPTGTRSFARAGLCVNQSGCLLIVFNQIFAFNQILPCDLIAIGKLFTRQQVSLYENVGKSINMKTTSGGGACDG